MKTIKKRSHSNMYIHIDLLTSSQHVEHVRGLDDQQRNHYPDNGVDLFLIVVQDYGNITNC